MKHFSQEEWADFARNTLSGEQIAVMQNHLQNGCKACASTLSIWTRVHKAAGRESAYQPSDSAVRMTKGMGAIHLHPAGSSAPKLLFDSAQNAVAAGVRSTSTLGRQVLYGVDPFRIDLRMEPLMDSDKVSIVGQILNSVEPANRAGDMPVVLWKGRKILAKSLTNNFGEFQVECDLEGDLHLQLSMPTGAEVMIPLIEPNRSDLAAVGEIDDSNDVRGTHKRPRRSTRK
ncbi:MAG: hypothetical protein ACRD5R_07065 [Candidatus Acidiferrales bacterium]